MLVELSKESSEAVADKKRVESEIRALDYFLDLIAKGKIGSDKELRVRAINKLDSRGYLLDERDNFVEKNGLYFGIASTGDFKVDPTVRIEDEEKLSILTELYSLGNDNSIPQEIRSNLIAIYKGDEKAAARLETILSSSEDEQLQNKIENLLFRESTSRRKLNLEKSFYDILNASVDIAPAIAVLETYEGKETDDLVLVEKLRTKALAKRRTEILKVCWGELKSPSVNYDQSLAIIDVLGKSQFPKDREAFILAAKEVYKLELANYRGAVAKTVNYNSTFEEIQRVQESLPLRPSIGEYDYVQTQIDIKEKTARQFSNILGYKRLETGASIRGDFGKKDPDTILSKIDALPDDTQQDINLKRELVNLYKSYAATNDGEMFDERFAKQIIDKIQTDLEARFVSPEKGLNKEALSYLRERFITSIFPLVESFRDDPRTKEVMEDFLEKETSDDEVKNPRLKYIQKLKILESQRPLTDNERLYLESVQLLSVFNPYLVGVVTADFGVTSEFLRHHFENISRQTITELKDGDYVPLIQVGLGPNGVAALGEVVRNNPELAAQMLVVDQGDQPGGPFAIPQGKAWELNSANRRGTKGPTLPDEPNFEELKTVRAYGSPLRWYPGERSKRSKNVRQGSINTTVDYLPVPDDLSIVRYPTNEDLQMIIALQAAMLVKRVALKTKVIEITDNPNIEDQGDKIVTLEIEESNGKTRTLKLKTDGRFIASGLGERTYGFDERGKRAERVIEETKNMKEFPKLSTTLDAFRSLAGRVEKRYSPGETLVIYGGGNSADTLLEFIGNIFQSDNPLVREISKVYVVTEKNLSARPRYSLINDLKPRNGRGNLIEFVNGKVGDVDFTDNSPKIKDRKIVVYDTQGNIIVDNEGNPIVADAAIAAAGFRAQLDEVFSSSLEGRSFKSSGEDSAVEPLLLPTNDKVSVANTLKGDSNTLFLGVASKPGFDSPEKLSQLPQEAREALLRNGAENAVAIGFRAPDTQAAVNIWLNSRQVNLEKKEIKEREQLQLEGDIRPGVKIRINKIINNGDGFIPDFVGDEASLLSPLISYEIGNKIELFTTKDGQTKDFTGTLTFSVEYNQNTQDFLLGFESGSPSLSKEVWEELVRVFMGKDIQKYALSILKKRRKDPKLEVSIAFQRGKLNPRKTFAQGK